MDNETILRRSQSLRKQMTKEERHLWYDYLRTYPVQFKRQYPIGCYIVDFFCFRAKLIIELDGSQHCDQHAYDAKRTAYLAAQGYHVFRVSNLDIVHRFRGVCEAIDQMVKSRMQG